MPPRIPSLHHVTATVDEASPDVRFYTRVLGLRLVKKTVNFDNHGVYHFYYGDELGRPSSLMTTFPYGGQGVRVGVKGAGQITVTSFSVPPGSLEFWRERFLGHGLEPSAREERFGEGSIMVQDPSGLNIELVEGPGDERAPWGDGGVETEAAIRGIHGVTLLVRDAPRSVRFLTETLGLEEVGSDGPRTRVSAAGGGPGSYLEVIGSAPAPDAVNGLGTVHHVALAVGGDEAQLEFRQRILHSGYQVTPVRDRQYFRSIYFREPGGILYEIATLGPGFAIDEDPAELGSGLRLPPDAEPERARIEAVLPRIDPPGEGEAGGPTEGPPVLSTRGAGGPHAGGVVATAGTPLGAGPGVMILVHGRNAGARNVLELARAMDRPEFSYIAPEASDRTWYPHSFMAERSSNEPGITSGLAVIDTLLRQVLEAGIPVENVMLLGFSQGACLTAEYAYRHPSRFGGVIVYSGGLIGPPGTTWTSGGGFDGVPVFLGCSDVDSHVPKARVEESAQVFRRMGAEVTERIYPGMGHLVNDEEIEFARGVMDRILSR